MISRPTTFMQSILIILSLFALTILANPFGFEIVMLIMTLSYVSRQHLFSHRYLWITLILASSTAVFLGYRQVFGFSLFSIMGFNSKILNGSLDAYQYVAFVCNLALSAALPYTLFSNLRSDRAKYEPYQVAGLSIVVLAFGTVFKWNHFMTTIPTYEAIGRSGIRIFGDGPNSTITILLLVAATALSGSAVAGLVMFLSPSSIEDGKSP